VLPPLWNYPPAEDLALCDFAVANWCDNDIPLVPTGELYKCVSKFLEAATSFLEANLLEIVGRGCTLIRVVLWLRLRLQMTSIGKFGEWLFALNGLKRDPNFELIEMMNLVHFTVDPDQVIEFFTGHYSDWIALFRSEIDLPARLDTFLRTCLCPRLMNLIFQSGEFRNAMRDLMSKKPAQSTVAIVRRLFSSEYSDGILSICFQNADCMFRNRDLFCSLVRIVKQKKYSDWIVEAFLLHKKPGYVAALVLDFVKHFKFTFSQTIDEKVEDVVGVFFEQADDEFSVVLECFSQSQEFAAKFMATAIGSIGEREFSSERLLMILTFLVRLNALIENPETCSENFIILALEVSGQRDAWNELEKIPAVDELTKILGRGEFAANESWAAALYDEVMALECLKSKSVLDFVCAYFGKIPSEEAREKFENLWNEIPEAFERVVPAIAAIMEANEELREIAQTKLPLAQEVVDSWPDAIGHLKQRFLQHQ